MFKVWAVIERPGFESVPIVIDEMMPPQLREMLEFFVGPEHPIVVLDGRRERQGRTALGLLDDRLLARGRPPGSGADPRGGALRRRRRSRR